MSRHKRGSAFKKEKAVEVIQKPKRRLRGVTAKTPEQVIALKAIHDNQISIIYGPAGTGKTHMAIHYGMWSVLKKKHKKLILTRPIVEAYGERLGFLPGNALDKIEPYMIPLLQLLYLSYPKEEVKKWIDDEIITTIPLALMRGYTFDDCYIVADEMQNTIKEQVRLLLTRTGDNTKVVLTGDISQKDIAGVDGLTDAIHRLKDLEDVAVVPLTLESVVRSPIVVSVERRYLKDISIN